MIDKILLTSQKRTKPEAKKINIIPKTNGIMAIIFAWTGSGLSLIHI